MGFPGGTTGRLSQWILLGVLILILGVGGFWITRPRAGIPALTAEVLNGTREPRLAWRTTLWLRQRGVDVWYYGNAPEDTVQTTFILAVTPDPGKAERLSRALPCHPPVEHREDPVRVVDVVIVLGKDAPRCFPGLESVSLQY